MRIRIDFSSANSFLAYLQFSELQRGKSKSQQRVLSEYWFCTCSGCCWLLQRCMIMGNNDNICPQSQERTNILSTSKSSLIWQGRRSGMLSCTHVSWQGQERGFSGNHLPVQTWPFNTEDHIHCKEISPWWSQTLPSFRVSTPTPLIPEWLPTCQCAVFFTSKCGSRT